MTERLSSHTWAARWELLIAAVAVSIIVVFLVSSNDLQAAISATLHGNLSRLRLDLNHLGAAGVLLVTAVVLLHTVLPFPIEIVAAAAAWSMGFLIALITLLGALLLSALLSYSIGARMGRPAVTAVAGPARVRRFEDWVAQRGAVALIAMRLIPLIPFSPVGMMCGMARVPLRRFLWTTALGILPELAIVASLGTQLGALSPDQPLLWVLGAAGLALLVGSGWIARRVGMPVRLARSGGDGNPC